MPVHFNPHFMLIIWSTLPPSPFSTPAFLKNQPISIEKQMFSFSFHWVVWFQWFFAWSLGVSPFITVYPPPKHIWIVLLLAAIIRTQMQVLFKWYPIVYWVSSYYCQVLFKCPSYIFLSMWNKTYWVLRNEGSIWGTVVSYLCTTEIPLWVLFKWQCQNCQNCLCEYCTQANETIQDRKICWMFLHTQMCCIWKELLSKAIEAAI